jgi:hypothetical protein
MTLKTGCGFLNFSYIAWCGKCDMAKCDVAKCDVAKRDVAKCDVAKLKVIAKRRRRCIENMI